MDANIILIAILAVPPIILTVLRVNAAQVFLSLCLGAVLVQFVASDAATLLASTSARSIKASGIPTNQAFVNLLLLLLPVVLTTIIMIKSVKGHARLAYNIFPAIAVGALGALLAVPLLSGGLAGSITHMPLWTTLQNLQTLVIGVGTLLALLSLWMQRPKKVAGGEEKGGKH